MLGDLGICWVHVCVSTENQIWWHLGVSLEVGGAPPPSDPGYPPKFYSTGFHVLDVHEPVASLYRIPQVNSKK